MTVTRHFFRNAQTVSGTGGTVYDLSTTQDTNATLLSAAISATSFTKIFEWRAEVGSALPEASIPVSVSINAVSASTLEVRWRVSRYNSSNVLQASSGYSALYNTTGTKTDTLTLTTDWAAGDFIAVEAELRRATGGGSRTVTFNVNNAATYIDPDLVTPANSGSGTASLTLSAVGVGSTVRSGSGSGGLTLDASGVGFVTRSGAGSASLVLSAEGVGEAPASAGPNNGSGDAELTLGAEAVGYTTRSGSGSAAIGLSAVAVGSSPNNGSGPAGLSLSAVGIGYTLRSGSGVGTLLLSAAAEGQVPSAGEPNNGSGIGSLSLDAVGVGSAPRGGSGQASVTLSASADGFVTRSGSGSAGLVLDGIGTSSTRPIKRMVGFILMQAAKRKRL